MEGAGEQTHIDAARLPTAHTCFNQIVLPTSYASAAQLREKLLLAVTEGGGGFTEM